MTLIITCKHVIDHKLHSFVYLVMCDVNIYHDIIDGDMTLYHQFFLYHMS